MPPPRRGRGRPAGGGNTAEQARLVLMDAAEQSILSRGFVASTMAVIARDAGYSRPAMYQHFPTRRHLLEALVHRTTARYQSSIGERLPDGAGFAEIAVESLVIVATELIHDPLLKTMSEQADEGLVGRLVAENPSLPALVATMIEIAEEDQLRPGLRAGDIAQYFISTAVALLLGVVPGTDDPDTARRYIETFFLPAILAAPPGPRPVFDHRDASR
ncbi:TetR/AcrR family transcriptional regulator [Mycobacterium sp. C31M]